MTKAGIRKRLLELMDTLAMVAAELRCLEDELRNRPPVTRAQRTSVPMTPQLQREIRALHRANPKMPQQQIADILGLNHGRVSEVLAGKRR